MNFDLLGVKNDPSLFPAEKTRIHWVSEFRNHDRKLDYFRGDSTTERCTGVSYRQSPDNSKPAGSRESLRPGAMSRLTHSPVCLLHSQYAHAPVSIVLRKQ